MTEKEKQKKAEQELETAGFTNDLIFGALMKNTRLCKRLLEIILDVELDSIEVVDTQKSISEDLRAKGIRLDAYAKGGNVIYNIEMQTTKNLALPKRARYYQGLIDLDLIHKGQSYAQLNKSYVIFICTFDLFKKGYPIYRFENRCIDDLELRFGDEATKIFLNPDSTRDGISDHLKSLLDYIAGKKVVGDPFIEKIESEIELLKADREWRHEFMIQSIREFDIREESKEEGREEEREKLVIKALNKGMSAEDIINLFELDDNFVYEIVDRLQNKNL